MTTSQKNSGCSGGIKFKEGQFDLAKLTKEMVDVFVNKVIVEENHRIEIVWKFRDEKKISQKKKIKCNKTKK